MSELPPDLQTAVKDQSEARVAMNVTGYAKYLTPEAVDTLRASFPGIPPRVNKYEIASVDGGGDDYTVNVRYFERDTPFIVSSRWHKQDSGWMVVRAERIWGDGDERPGFVSKLVAKVLGPIARRR
ncbi:MAG: hypothetical protein ABI559_09370 [Chloroflexota bacterium]